MKTIHFTIVLVCSLAFTACNKKKAQNESSVNPQDERAQHSDSNLKNENGIVVEKNDHAEGKKSSSEENTRDKPVRALLQGVDLTGLYHLTASPNKEFVAGATYESKSWIKVWSVERKKLLHEFRVSGKAHALTFTPDSATLITADATGNLGNDTTFRTLDIAEGKERKLGTSPGSKLADHCFSPDGHRWTTLTLLGAWDHPTSVVQINVWPFDGKGKPVRIDISHPFGWVELRPTLKAALEDNLWQVVPTHVRFSSDGKQLICKTESGLRTIYDSRTGELLEHANVSSVGMFESVLMIALHQAPNDAKSLTLDVTPSELSVKIQRAADGWWRVGKSGQLAYKVDGEDFVSLIKGVEKTEPIIMGLGLKDGTDLGKLSSFKHPLGVIKLNRDEAGMKFRLEEVKAGTETGETLQTGEVHYQNKTNNAAPTDKAAKAPQKTDRTNPKAVAVAFWNALLAHQWKIAASFVGEDDRARFLRTAPRQIPEVPNPPKQPVIKVEIDGDEGKTRITNWKEWEVDLEMFEENGNWWVED